MSQRLPEEDSDTHSSSVTTILGDSSKRRANTLDRTEPKDTCIDVPNGCEDSNVTSSRSSSSSSSSSTVMSDIDCEITNDPGNKIVVQFPDPSEHISQLYEMINDITISMEHFQIEQDNRARDFQKIIADISKIKTDTEQLKSIHVIQDQAARIKSINVTGIQSEPGLENRKADFVERKYKRNFIKAMRRFGCLLNLSEIESCKVVENAESESNDEENAEKVLNVKFVSQKPLEKILSAKKSYEHKKNKENIDCNVKL